MDCFQELLLTPPALAFANDMSNSEIPALTYASVYPLTTFLRIMVAQLLIVFFCVMLEKNAYFLHPQKKTEYYVWKYDGYDG